MKATGRSLGAWVADALVVVALALWAIGASNLPEFVLPGPVAVGKRLIELFTQVDFLEHTLASTWRVILSVGVALVVGGGLALLARAVPVLDGIISGLIQPFFNAFPSIGWAILAAIWFTPGHLSIIFVQVAVLIPFCLINIAEGLRQVDREMIEMATSFTRRRARILARVGFPLLLPYVVGSLRIAYGVAWKIGLVAELLGSTSGLGFLMLRAQGSADMVTVVAACLSIVVLFWLGERLIIDPLARRYATR